MAVTTRTAEETADSPETSKQRRNLRPLLALQPYLLRHRDKIVYAGLALLVAATATLAIPVAVRRMIDFGFAGGSTTFISQYFAMLILIGGVLAIASACRFYFVSWLGERVVADLRADVFAHLAKLGPGYFDTAHSGEAMSRLSSDTTQIKSAAATAVSQAVRSTITIIGALVMMLITSPMLSVLVIAVIPLIVLPLLAYGRVVRRKSRAAQDSLADASALAAENLGAVRTMQAFTAEASIARRFQAATEIAFEDARSRLTARAVMTALAIVLVVVSIVGVLWVGASMVIAGTITAGRLSQFLLYSVFAAGSLAQLSEVWGEVQQAAGAAERLFELLETKPKITAPAAPARLPNPVAGRVTFENVAFAYPSRPNAPALDDVSFVVQPGERIALVGPSGAGKSSIFNLISRFYDPTSGRVLVDGIDVRDVDPVALRDAMAVVPQEINLFAGTIAENISYGRDKATADDIKAAAIAANADAFIQAFDDGYGTVLGEDGVTLSGGQRQRIAIARAVLRNPSILLLDEATSALDTESERAVQEALDRIMEGRTTLVITHRLSTVRRADRILVLDEGRIVEEGSHEALTTGNGLYTRLDTLQHAPRAAE